MTLHIFREYDIRGVAERDLTDSRVEAIGAALATLLPPSGSSSKKIVVARDCRESGPRLRDAMIKGLIAGGAEVIDVGVGATPMMYFSVHHLGAAGGVMITGSHNPPDENGFKLMTGKLSFFGEQIQELAKLVETGAIERPGTGSVSTENVEEAYLNALTKDFDFSAHSSLRCVIDAGNGAAGPLGSQAFARLGLKPVELFCDMDGNFPNHHPDPTMPENLVDLIAAMKESKAQVGLAWDGDGDRLGVVDPSGEIVWGDRLLALYAREALPQNQGAAIIGDVKCSQILFDDIKKHGGTPIMWKTGHSLIKAKMKEEKALIAGEMSGHFFFADRYLGFDDGIYAALRTAEIVAKHGKSVSELLADLPQSCSTPEIRRNCPDELKFEVISKVRAYFRGREPLVEIDGARVNYKDGAWGLARASNTGPIIVLRFEASSPERLAEVQAEMETVLQNAIRATQE